MKCSETPWLKIFLDYMLSFALFSVPSHPISSVRWLLSLVSSCFCCNKTNFPRVRLIKLILYLWVLQSHVQGEHRWMSEWRSDQSTSEWTWWACVALKLRNLLHMSNKNVFMAQVARLQPLRWDQQENNQVHLLKYFPQI